MNVKECTKKCDVHAELLFCGKTIVFWCCCRGCWSTLLMFLHILTSSVIYYLKYPRQHGIPFIQWTKKKKLFLGVIHFPYSKAWFPCDHPNRPDRPSRFKILETIRTTGAIGSFHMIVSIASKARDVGSSAMSLGQTIEFLCVFCKQAT